MYFAHSGAKGGGRAEPLREHLNLVSERAARYAGFFGAEAEARIAGLLHDLGKYSDLFKQRLQGRANRLDHWSAGAYVALLKYRIDCLGAALSIQGHHIGLQHGYPPPLARELDLNNLSAVHPLGLRLTEKDPGLLQKRIDDDGLYLPPISTPSFYDPGLPSIAGMLDARMLFSALVDADYIETEAHFEGEPDGTKRYRPEGPPLEAARATQILDGYLHRLRQDSKASGQINGLRDDLLDEFYTLNTAHLFTIIWGNLLQVFSLVKEKGRSSAPIVVNLRIRGMELGDF